jgi:hypothetical protein
VFDRQRELVGGAIAHNLNFKEHQNYVICLLFKLNSKFNFYRGTQNLKNNLSICDNETSRSGETCPKNNNKWLNVMLFFLKQNFRVNHIFLNYYFLLCQNIHFFPCMSKINSRKLLGYLTKKIEKKYTEKLELHFPYLIFFFLTNHIPYVKIIKSTFPPLIFIYFFSTILVTNI